MQTYEFLVTLCASHASAIARLGSQEMKQAKYGSVQDLRAEAVSAGTKAVKVAECIACGCTGGIDCEEEHPTVPENCAIVFMAAQDVLQLVHHKRAPPAVACITRYLPQLFELYGAADPDVILIRDMCEGFEAMVAAPAAPAAATAEQAAPSDPSDWLAGTGASGGNQSKSKSKGKSKKGSKKKK